MAGRVQDRAPESGRRTHRKGLPGRATKGQAAGTKAAAQRRGDAMAGRGASPGPSHTPPC